MQINADSPEHYIEQLPEDRKEPIRKLRQIVLDNLPEGFEEVINYGMIGYVVPHSLYPDGYHADPKQPLPFLNIASQKNHIAFYHMGIYSDNKLMKWFTEEYSKVSKVKLDMGKSCMRFKKPEHIPYELLGELCSKITPDMWIRIYEDSYKR